jgi:hypothetical protein
VRTPFGTWKLAPDSKDWMRAGCISASVSDAAKPTKTSTAKDLVETDTPAGECHHR